MKTIEQKQKSILKLGVILGISSLIFGAACGITGMTLKLYGDKTNEKVQETIDDITIANFVAVGGFVAGTVLMAAEGIFETAVDKNSDSDASKTQTSQTELQVNKKEVSNSEKKDNAKGMEL